MPSFFYFMVSRKKLLLIALLALPIPACTSINIRGNEDNEAIIKKVYGFPIYNITPSNQSNSVYIRTTGIGVVKGVTGISIGYLNETYAAVPAGKCSIVIFSATERELSNIRKALALANTQPDDVCLLTQEGKSHD